MKHLLSVKTGPLGARDNQSAGLFLGSSSPGMFGPLEPDQRGRLSVAQPQNRFPNQGRAGGNIEARPQQQVKVLERAPVE